MSTAKGILRFINFLLDLAGCEHRARGAACCESREQSIGTSAARRAGLELLGISWALPLLFTAAMLGFILADVAEADGQIGAAHQAGVYRTGNLPRNRHPVANLVVANEHDVLYEHRRVFNELAGFMNG